MPGYRGTATAPPNGAEFILAAKTYALKSYLLGYWHGEGGFLILAFQFDRLRLTFRRRLANTSLMPDYSRHQKGIIQRYYDNREKIMLERLGTIVTELFLVESDKKRDALWKRAAKAMHGLKVPPKLAEHILSGRDAEVLARNVRDWERKPPEVN